jgi:Ca2+-binding RTX toxin-like protein
VGTDADDDLHDDQSDETDVVWLGRGHDTWISYGAGADIVCGGEGGDRLSSYAAGSKVFGGPGNDILVTGADATGWGEEGRDFLRADGRIYGGTGNDNFSVVSGRYYGGPGDDDFDVQALAQGAVVIGGADRDSVRFFTSALSVDLEKRVARWDEGFISLRGINVVEGTRFADVIKGNDRRNNLDGGQGNDHVYGRGGDDYLSGGDVSAPRDVVYGGPGNDFCEGDQLYGCEDYWTPIGG